MTLRIAFVIEHASRGGGQDLYALELLNRLGAEHAITLFARSATGLDERVTFHPIATPSRPGLLRSQVFQRRAARQVAKSVWDIVHSIGGSLPGATVLTTAFCHARGAGPLRQRR